jgi:hypothetical protein
VQETRLSTSSGNTKQPQTISLLSCYLAHPLWVVCAIIPSSPLTTVTHPLQLAQLASLHISIIIHGFVDHPQSVAESICPACTHYVECMLMVFDIRFYAYINIRRPPTQLLQPDQRPKCGQI